MNDFAVSAFKHQILSMMKFLDFRTGDVEFVEGVNIGIFDAVYCNIDGTLVGASDGFGSIIDPSPEIFLKAIHSSLMRKCHKKIDFLDASSSFLFLSLLLKKHYQILFIDL